jgi:hypothetical protein
MLVETTSILAGAITGAIRKAAEITGAGFDYLLATARIESGLNPTVKARTSSASGLFQFIEQTWLATLKQAGPSLGYARFAQAIEKTSSGRHIVRDPVLRSRIMDLRNDPTANALMAGAFTRGNAARMRAQLGRPPSEGELYMAHFLGTGGATKLISAAAHDPHEKAAKMFPGAAAANRAIFYNKQGSARSVVQVYGLLTAKLNRARDAGSHQVALAELPVPQPVAAPIKRMPAIEVAALAPVTAIAAAAAPVTANTAAPTPVPMTKVEATPLSQPSRPAPPRPVFHELFHDDGRGIGRGPVSAVVAELWGPKTGSGASGPSLSRAPGVDVPVDVFGLTRHQRARS